MKPVLISCGSAKLENVQNVQAWTLYTGGYFKQMLKLAVHLSDEVYIVSAGYGLLKLNDLVNVYDLKMDKKRAIEFKEMDLINVEAISLLGAVYEGSISGEFERFFDPSLAMGKRIQYSMNYIKENNLKPLIDLEELQDGELRKMIYHEKLKDAIDIENKIHDGIYVPNDDITSLFG